MANLLGFAKSAHYPGFLSNFSVDFVDSRTRECKNKLKVSVRFEASIDFATVINADAQIKWVIKEG